MPWALFGIVPRRKQARSPFDLLLAQLGLHQSLDDAFGRKRQQQILGVGLPPWVPVPWPATRVKPSERQKDAFALFRMLALKSSTQPGRIEGRLAWSTGTERPDRSRHRAQPPLP